MPSQEFTRLTDEDLAAIVAYARSVPPVRRVMPASYAGPLLRTLTVAGKVNVISADSIDHARPHDARLAVSARPYGNR